MDGAMGVCRMAYVVQKTEVAYGGLGEEKSLIFVTDKEIRV